MFPKIILPLAVGLAVSLPAAARNTHSTLKEALEGGGTQLHFRLRYEDVDEAQIGTASATTLLTRLTFTSGSWHGLGLTLEMDDTSELFDEDYKTRSGDSNPPPVIADPEVTELNQAYLGYASADAALTARLGRQRILLDNQRFVGGVGWRQDEQTFDGMTLNYQAPDRFSIFYGYITKVNRIFAEYEDHSHATHLINARLKTGQGTLVAYAYLVDNETVINLSSNTYGARWQGHVTENLTYNLEYARQSEAADATPWSAGYQLLEIAGTLPGDGFPVNLKAGYEVLGSDNGTRAFTTSLATLHAFQGWTDKFLATPADGINDRYVSVGTQVNGVNLSIVWHDLTADFGSADYGTEIGLVATAKAGPVGLTLKYADFSSDGYSTDTSKLWLMAAATF